jgi:hypothetical protein
MKKKLLSKKIDVLYHLIEHGKCKAAFCGQCPFYSVVVYSEPCRIKREVQSKMEPGLTYESQIELVKEVAKSFLLSEL